MKRLKFVMILGLLFGAVSLIAQPPGGGQGGRPSGAEGEQGERPQRGQRANMTPEQFASMAVERLNRVVPLDSAQMELVYNLNLSMMEPLEGQLPQEEVKNLDRKERKAYNEQLKEAQEQRQVDFQNSLYEILTPPQIEQYEAYVKQMQERMQQQGGQGGPGGGQGGPGGGQGGMGGGMGGGRM